MRIFRSARRGPVRDRRRWKRRLAPPFSCARRGTPHPASQGRRMQAIVCRAYGPPKDLVLAEVPDPVPGPGQVLIDVHAAGVNFPDVLLVQGLYQVKPPLPFTPGVEAAGIVTAVGEGVEE